MLTPNFKLPKTKLALVVWYRNGKRNETLISTPDTCQRLANNLFEQHRIGPSEIRAVKSVEPTHLIGQRL